MKETLNPVDQLTQIFGDDILRKMVLNIISHGGQTNIGEIKDNISDFATKNPNYLDMSEAELLIAHFAYYNQVVMNGTAS